jgi:hypothetical protein
MLSWTQTERDKQCMAARMVLGFDQCSPTTCAHTHTEVGQVVTWFVYGEMNDFFGKVFHTSRRSSLLYIEVGV